jgi:hypothetical protein
MESQTQTLELSQGRAGSKHPPRQYTVSPLGMLAVSIGSSIRCSKLQQIVLWNKKGQKGDATGSNRKGDLDTCRKKFGTTRLHMHTLRHISVEEDWCSSCRCPGRHG